jgi:hypothetical protein
VHPAVCPKRQTTWLVSWTHTNIGEEREREKDGFAGGSKTNTTFHVFTDLQEVQLQSHLSEKVTQTLLPTWNSEFMNFQVFEKKNFKLWKSF